MSSLAGGHDRESPSIGSRPIEGVVFDKDGTLLDFHRTWDRAVGVALRELATDERSLRGAASAIGYDLTSSTVAPDSPLVAESNATITELLTGWLETPRFDAVLLREGTVAATPVPGAARLLDALAGAMVEMALVTNDSEVVARRQVARLGWDHLFATVVGYDSGFGEKPAPGPVAAAVEVMGSRPSATILVGDSAHDLASARAAGVTAVYVGSEPDLREDADVAVTDLSELAGVLGIPPA